MGMKELGRGIEDAMEANNTGPRLVRERKRSRPAPPPTDGALFSLDDAAAHLRMTPGAFRKLVAGRADGSDGELGDLLRGWLVTLTPYRRYIKRGPFLAWLREKSSDGSGSSPAV